MPTPMTTFNVLDYGADLSGVSDSFNAFTSAISAALSAVGGVGGVVIAPPGTYKISSGLIVPPSVSLEGENFQPSNPSGGTTLLFAASIPVCLTLGGAVGNNGCATLKRVIVTRQGSNIRDDSVGILIENLYGSIVEDVFSKRHAIPFWCRGKDTLGISYRFNRIFTAIAADVHLIIDGIAELYFNQCRFGENGEGDRNCNSYVRIQNTLGISGSVTPNTIFFDNCHFNQGINSTLHWLEFKNDNVEGISSGELKFTDCHVESVSNERGYYIVSDSSWKLIRSISIKGCTLLSFCKMLNLDPVTKIGLWLLSGNEIYTTSFELNPNEQIDAFSLVGNRFGNGGVTILAPQNSTINSIGNIYGGNLSISGNNVSFTSIDNFLAGSVTSNITGPGAIILTGNYTQVGGGPKTVTSRFSGSTDAVGIARFPHGISLGSRRILSASGYVENTTDVGIAMNLDYFDNADVRFSSSQPSKRYRAFVTYSFDIPAW